MMISGVVLLCSKVWIASILWLLMDTVWLLMDIVWLLMDIAFSCLFPFRVSSFNFIFATAT